MDTKQIPLFAVVAGVLALVVILGLLFPAVPIGPESPGRSATKAGVIQITAALKQYYNEYGRWPDLVGKGRFLDATSNARVMGVLCAQDDINNPRKIVFFEGAKARRNKILGGRLVGGFDPQSGAFLDSWGNPYRIVLDHDYDEVIDNPYPQDPFGPSIRTKVIVWSLGKDGKQGLPTNSQVQQGSDDVVSWN